MFRFLQFIFTVSIRPEILLAYMYVLFVDLNIHLHVNVHVYMFVEV